MSVRTNIIREDHPNFWSFFALVSATMDQIPYLVSLAASAEDVARLDVEFSTWPLHDVVLLAGVVDDDDTQFDILVGTEIGRLVNEWLQN